MLGVLYIALNVGSCIAFATVSLVCVVFVCCCTMPDQYCMYYKPVNMIGQKETVLCVHMNAVLST